MVDIVYFFLYICVHILSAASFMSIVFCAKGKPKKNGANKTLKSGQDMTAEDQLKFNIRNAPEPSDTELKSDADANLLGNKRIHSKIMSGNKDQQGNQGPRQTKSNADASVLVMAPGEHPNAAPNCAQKPRFAPSNYVSK